MATRIMTHVLLPLLVFPSLSFAAYHFILNRSLFQSGLQSKFDAICDTSAPAHPFRFTYTNNPNADKVLCGMVAFFHALMDPIYRPLLAELVSTFGVLILVLFLESARDRRSAAVRTPAAIAMLAQLASMGVIFPIYSLLFVSSGTASLRPSTSARINQGNAEALLFGFGLGYILPTALMLVYEQPTFTASWQIFPFFIALSEFVHRLGRPPAKLTSSGHTTVRFTLILAFVLATLAHAVYVWPIMNDIMALRTMFVPNMGVPDPARTTLTEGVVEFIKWDLIFGAGSFVLASLWMVNSVLQLLVVVLWYVVATVVLGPGAAIAGIFLWREISLQENNQAEKTPEKTD